LQLLRRRRALAHVVRIARDDAADDDDDEVC
jgi:hypothetical protein